MTQTIPITVYTADCTGNASSCLYPNKIEIADEASAKLSFSKDLVCAGIRTTTVTSTILNCPMPCPGTATMSTPMIPRIGSPRRMSLTSLPMFPM